MHTAVIGASNKPARYSYQAVMLLKEKGHTPWPVHPALSEIEGMPVYPSLSQVPVPVDTVTLYLAPAHQQRIEEEVAACRPRRVIFNPGTENPAWAERFRAEGIETLEACTLVLLRTGQF